MNTLRRQKKSAFTLVELLMVIAVLTLLMTFAMVGMGDGGRSQQLTVSGNRVADLVNLARHTAKTRNSMSMLIVVTKGNQAYRAMTILEKPLEGSSWKQVSPWEVLPDGIGVSAGKSATFLTQPVAALSPAPPSLSFRGAALNAADYAWQVFLPNGRLLSDQSSPPILYLSSVVNAGNAPNYYSITINANTGIPIIRRP